MMFYWDQWNTVHVAKHGVTREQAIFIVRRARAPYPLDAGSGKLRVWGSDNNGRLIQVIYSFISPDRMDYEQMTYDDILQLETDTGPYIYILHARPLTEAEKRIFNKRRR